MYFIVQVAFVRIKLMMMMTTITMCHFIIYYKIRTTGYTNKTQCKKKKIYNNTQKVHYEVHKNHIIKSTSDSQNSEI